MGGLADIGMSKRLSVISFAGSDAVTSCC
jgi:hypothetical protein